MQSEAIQLKTTNIALYLLSTKADVDLLIKEQHERIIDDCTKSSDFSSFLGVIQHPITAAEYLYVSFWTKEGYVNQGLHYPVRAIIHLTKEELKKKASKQLKAFLSKDFSFLERIKTPEILEEILQYVAKTIPGVPVTEPEPVS